MGRRGRLVPIEGLAFLCFTTGLHQQAARGDTEEEHGGGGGGGGAGGTRLKSNNPNTEVREQSNQFGIEIGIEVGMN